MKNTNDLFNFLPKEIDAFLLTTSDEFLGEYVPNYSQRLKFVTGFSGSVGFAIIVKNGKSKLFVDGRYTLQAENECGKDYDIFDITLLFKELKNHKFAIDGRFYSLNFIENLKERGMNFEIINQCPLDEIWKRDIIFECKTENFELAGETKEEKLAKVRNFLKENNADALFLHDPHDICYAFNIRGNYLEFSPIIPFFAFISRESEGLVAPKDVPNLKLGKVLLSKSASYNIFTLLSQNNEIIFEKEDFLANQKAVKTEFEIECIKKAHIQDGKALKEFISWLKKAKLENETEFSIGQKLIEFRKKQEGFICESFSSIVGFKENGAIVHYRALENSCKQIKGEGLLLIDSGGQYYSKKIQICGTTDVTRVFAIGTPNDEEKRAYTLVLKGHIALCEAVFPSGTTGGELEFLARQFLFKQGLNFNHGTGHGVGYFLSVHEGPCGFSKRSNVVLKAGMVLSNEPGFYKENAFGIRFENLLFIKNAPFEGFLEFEILTKAPIEAKLLDYQILTDDELEWLMEYTNFVNHLEL